MALTLTQYAAQTRQPMMMGIVDRITYRSIFLRILKFIQVPGLTYSYNRREALPGIQFRGINQPYTTPASVINPQTEPLAILGGQIDTDTILMDANGTQARSNEIAGSVINAGIFFDNYVFHGDPAAVPGSFPGLNTRLTGNQYILAGANGGALTLEMVDQVIDQVLGSTGKVLLMNKAVRRNLTVLLRNAAKVTTYDEVSRQVGPSYNGVPIEIVDEDANQVPILSENETVGTATTCASIYCVRTGGETDGEFMQGLVGTANVVHRDVGLLGTFYRDVVEMLGGIGVFHPRAAARLGGILVQ